ncbi:Molecular chaperone (DnaJ super) [Fusarium solani]|nr:Molecular chaperone (DnaJ super) [Fusarium solani]
MVKETKLYDQLGIKPDANREKIKKAWRQMAMTWHPDKNKDNPDAEEMFKKCSEAYEILSDPEKRKLYDQFGLEYILRGRAAPPHDAGGGGGDDKKKEREKREREKKERESGERKREEREREAREKREREEREKRERIERERRQRRQRAANRPPSRPNNPHYRPRQYANPINNYIYDGPTNGPPSPSSRLQKVVVNGVPLDHAEYSQLVRAGVGIRPGNYW